MPQVPAPDPADTSLQRQVGARIRQLRAVTGLNQDDFADAVGMHRSYIGQLENGHKDIRLSTLGRIAQTYGLTVWQLLDPDYPLESVEKMTASL